MAVWKYGTGPTGTSGRDGYWNETLLNWIVLSNLLGTSPSLDHESISGTYKHRSNKRKNTSNGEGDIN